MNIRSKIFGGAKAGEVPPILPDKKRKGAPADTLDGIKVQREEYRHADTRAADRHRLPNEQVRVTHNGRSADVQLVNLSGGGAMVAGDFHPMLWDRVDLHIGDGGVIECAVRWLRDDRVGLEFAHETQLDCSAGEQAALLREVILRSFPDVEFTVAENSTEEMDGGDDQRRERRHPLIWSGSLHHDYQTTPVRLRNISATGALIECAAPLVVGNEPVLDLGNAGQVFAVVTWVVGDQVGLKFQQPFDLGRLAHARPEVAPARWTAPAYLQAGPAEDSPWAEEWGRMSLGELREDLEGFMKR